VCTAHTYAGAYIFARGGFVEHNDGGPRRRRGRLIAAGAGLTALVAITAGAVIAFGPSSTEPAAAAANSAATPSATAQTAAPTTAPTTAPTAAPATASLAAHATGHVKNGVHTGDLASFLPAPPSGADVYGDPGGSPLGADDIAAGDAGTRAALTTYGFHDGVYRTYLTGDGVYEVSVDLLRFGSPGKAAAYDAAYSSDGTEIALDADYPARAYRLTSASAESTDAVIAVSHQGDVRFTLTVTGSRTLSPAGLRDLLDAQYTRLKTGR
jgi:hypothetical protein